LPLPALYWEQRWIYNLEHGDPISHLDPHFPPPQGGSWLSSLAQETKINLPVKGTSPEAAPGVANWWG